MKSSDTELGIGILIVMVIISCDLKRISLVPVIIWAVSVFVIIPLLDKLVLAATFHSPFVRWACKAAAFLVVTSICLLL